MSDRMACIDDVEAACAHLSPLGRRVVQDGALAVRSAIISVVRERGWRVVNYGTFRAWCRDKENDFKTWVALDPMFAGTENPHIVPLRLSRVLHGDVWRIEEQEGFAHGLTIGKGVVLVDDVAASGMTIRHAVVMLRERSIAVEEIVLCAATSVARKHLASECPGIKLTCCFEDEGLAAIHLRDACPYLPFSGRPSKQHPDVETSNGRVPIRIPSTTIRQGLWPHVFGDYRALVATVNARSRVAALLSHELGRDATVGDLRLLGRDIPLPAYPRHKVAEATLLSSLC